MRASIQQDQAVLQGKPPARVVVGIDPMPVDLLIREIVCEEC